jgi:hypothetical protein
VRQSQAETLGARVGAIFPSFTQRQEDSRGFTRLITNTSDGQTKGTERCLAEKSECMLKILYAAADLELIKGFSCLRLAEL